MQKHNVVSLLLCAALILTGKPILYSHWIWYCLQSLSLAI